MTLADPELPLGRCCPAHDCVAALLAAVGALVRIVVAILLDDDERSFGFARSVLNIPPGFFSGLGVLAVGCSVDGVWLGDAMGCALGVLDDLATSRSELSLVKYEGRFGGAGRRSETGAGRGSSA